MDRDLLGRAVLAVLCAPFIVSGVTKLLDYGGAMGEMAHFGLPLPAVTAALVIALQLTGSATVVFLRGVPAAAAAAALALFTLAATFMAHAYWTMSGEARFHAMNSFYEHLSIVAAFVFIARLDTQAAHRTGRA